MVQICLLKKTLYTITIYCTIVHKHEDNQYGEKTKNGTCTGQNESTK